MQLEEILALQPSYNARNTPEMRERGYLVRTVAGQWLEGYRTALAHDMEIPPSNVLIEGRDGTGLKSRIPWVRFASSAFSESATEGFYVVYLFDASGSAVYLSLNQGTTDYLRGEFVPKEAEIIASRVLRAREVVSAWLARRNDALEIELQDPNLGAGYERGNIAAVRYERGSVPPDSVLLADVRSYGGALGQLYRDQLDRPRPGEMPEVLLAERDAERSAAKYRRSVGGARFQTSPSEIKLIETYAKRLAIDHYEGEGWSVKERGPPFDLEILRGSERFAVAVKGTASDGSGLVLTAAEVEHHREAHPQNALVIVRDIALDRGTSPPTVSGGTLHEARGWSIDTARLEPISYAYSVPAALYE